jgi:hypothetical protein
MPNTTKKNVYNNMLVRDVFYILKYLKQQQDYDRMLEDLKYEEDCYFSSSYDYLM